MNVLAREATLIDDVKRLLEQYVVALDNRRFADWLNLFAANGYYGVIRYDDFVKGNSMFTVGEGMAKLRARCEAGDQVDRDRKLHFLSGIEVTTNDGINAISNFLVIRNGFPSFAGRYHLRLERATDGLKISRCIAVLDGDQVTETIYLPI
jgi:3-phenylpropionate/cinnamic acid dioxygenase small subunit